MFGSPDIVFVLNLIVLLISSQSIFILSQKIHCVLNTMDGAAEGRLYFRTANRRVNSFDLQMFIHLEAGKRVGKTPDDEIKL